PIQGGRRCYSVCFSLSALILVVSVPAHASWIICNRTPTEIFAAMAWVDPNSGFRSKGGWSLGACGGCRTLWNGNLPMDGDNLSQGVVFFYAEGTGKSVIWRGDTGHGFCVKSDAFD